MIKLKIIFVCLLYSSFLQAQILSDTLSLSIKDADGILLNKSLALIAAKYKVNAGEAYIKQSRLWDNPTLNTDQNIYDGKFFRHDNTSGTFYFQIMQTFRTAGKRRYAIEMAKDNKEINQQQFYDLMRTLRYNVHSDLIELAHLKESVVLYQDQINILTKLSLAMDAQLQAGNISLKENLRVKAILFGLKQELNSIEISALPLQSELRLFLLLNDSVLVNPVIHSASSMIKNLTLDSLINSALQNRPDLQLANLNLALQQHNFKLQKALAVPDVSAGVEYDQRSSYTPNVYGLTLSVPLPVFNRNQGNIKAAEYEIKQQEALTTLAQNKVRTEVVTAFNGYTIFINSSSSAYRNFVSDYEKIFEKMIQSYKERQISFLELTDYLDTYKDTKLKISEQESKLMQAAETINFTTNSNIIPLQ